MSREGKKKFDGVGPADIAMLNVKELEAFLKIDQKTIYRYVSLGLIPYVRIQSNITLREAVSSAGVSKVERDS